jgi:hypothetical protein
MASWDLSGGAARSYNRFEHFLEGSVYNQISGREKEISMYPTKQNVLNINEYIWEVDCEVFKYK